MANPRIASQQPAAALNIEFKPSELKSRLITVLTAGHYLYIASDVRPVSADAMQVYQVLPFASMSFYTSNRHQYYLDRAAELYSPLAYHIATCLAGQLYVHASLPINSVQSLFWDLAQIHQTVADSQTAAIIA